MEDSKENDQLAYMITPYSISVYGSSAGHANVSEDALVALSYHVTYNLYEILKECKSEMNVYRQTKLSTTILSNVFQNFGFPNMHGNKTSLPFIKVPNTDLYVINESDIDLVSESADEKVEIELESESFIKGLLVTPLAKVPSFTSHSNFINHVKEESRSETDEYENCTIDLYKAKLMQTVNRVETDYFLIVSQIILCSSENLLKIALEDLKTNPRLGGVYYSLLNLIGNSVKYFKCIGKLVDRLLRTVEALLNNPYFDPSPSLIVDEAIQSLCMLILDTKIASDCDDFPFRRRASYLLMRALNMWNVSIEERHKLLDTAIKMSGSPEKSSPKLNYCTLMMFYGLGCDNLDKNFWPSLNKYLSVLSSLDEIILRKRSIMFTTDISDVKSALLLITGILYRNFWTADKSIQEIHVLADKLLYEYFGESIAAVRFCAVPQTNLIFRPNTCNKSHNDESIPEIRKSYQKSYSTTFHKILSTRSKPGNIPAKHPSYDEIFERTSSKFHRRPIIFNFFGSTTVNSEYLKFKICDQRYNVACSSPPRQFLKYEKMTRCIKYCKTTKSCAGDKYLML